MNFPKNACIKWPISNSKSTHNSQLLVPKIDVFYFDIHRNGAHKSQVDNILLN